MKLRATLAAGLALLAASCTVGPDYKRPPLVTPESWRDAAAEEESLANVPWWELFQDETLQGLIRSALEQNRDLKIAVERIEEARARYGFTRADRWPEVNAEARAGGLRFSEASLTHIPEDSAEGNTTDLYSVGVSVSWEIDFFGRVRRASEAQRASMLATEEARRAVALAVVADVARAYVELRDLDQRLDIARRTLESRQTYVGLARDRFEGGVTPEVDLRQAEAELHRVEFIVHEIEKLARQKENEIAFLLGNNPQAVPRGRTLEDQPIPPAVPVGLPAALLERRPDLREAEQRLIEANAMIGEAKAQLYPAISLTGSFGFASTDLGDLLDSSSQSWNFFAGLLQPIFNSGKNKRRVEVRQSQTRQAVYAYERTLLSALREVEDSLIALEKSGAQRLAQGRRVAAERKVLELSELRYRGGVAAYLEVLDAQRSLFTAEIDEVASVSAQVISLIRLYSALGGGWPTSAEEESTVSSANSAGSP